MKAKSKPKVIISQKTLKIVKEMQKDWDISSSIDPDGIPKLTFEKKPRRNEVKDDN